MFNRCKFDVVGSTVGFLCLMFVVGCLIHGSAIAQTYPNKPITVVVPYPPGSTTDSLMRMLGPKLSERLGQTVIIDNRSGASTSIGTSYVAKAAPDGYTVLIQAPNIVTNEYMFDNLDWKYGDFKPVTLLVKWSNLLVAGPEASVKDFRDMVSAGEKESSEFTYGTPGIGSLSHLAIEMLNRRAGISMAHITYNGPAPMMTDLVGGHIKYGVTNPANLMPLVLDKKGRVTPLVVLSGQRDKTIPDVPSLNDFGIDGIDSNGWLGIVVPAQTSDEIVARLNDAFVGALNDDDVQKQIRQIYLETIGSTPEEFAEYLDSESRKWGEAIKAVNIRG